MSKIKIKPARKDNPRLCLAGSLNFATSHISLSFLFLLEQNWLFYRYPQRDCKIHRPAPKTIFSFYQRQKQLDILPGLALLERISEKICRMVGRHHGNSLTLMNAVPQLGYWLLRGEEKLGGKTPQG
jgi:hypothetical protein